MEHEPWHALPVDRALQTAGVDPNHGLSFQEAARRLQETGYNELAAAKRVSPLRQFANQFTDFIVLVLIGAAVISGPILREWTDAIAILVIVLINGILGFVQEYRAEQALQALRQLTAPVAEVVRDGRAHEIPAREIVPGDIVILDTGDLVPADGRLVSTRNLAIDQSVLTGESAPVNKNADIDLPPDTPLADRDNMVYSSTIVTRGRARMLVTATGMRTELGKIAQLVQEIGAEATPLQMQLERVGRYLVYAALAIVAIIFALGVARGEPVVQMFLIAVSLAVAAIPEGLPAVVTIALALGVRRMAVRNALVRRLRSVETLGAATVICTDKTGTLTENQMTVRRVITPQRTIQVTGEGYNPQGSFAENGQMVPREARDLQAVVQIGALSSTADLVRERGNGEARWTIRGDPTEGALIVAAAKAGFPVEAPPEYEFLEELPFDSQRKRMSIIYTYRGSVGAAGEPPLQGIVPGARVAFVKGAPEAVLPLSTQVQQDGKIAPLGRHERREFLDANSALGQQALRVLAMAYRVLPPDLPLTVEAVERDLVFVGMEAMIDPPRAQARDAVRTSQEAGITTVMITGDQINTAVAIAREVGIFHEGEVSLTGAELAEITDERLAEIVDRVRVYARTSPQDKLRIVEAWRARRQVVAMTGDGVNDAPALKQADIGVAMGLGGTEVAKEAADMVLTDDNFASIEAAVEEGRGVFDNLTKFITWTLPTNVGEGLIVLAAIFTGALLPILPAQILWINMTTALLLGATLALEPKEIGIMGRRPREPKAPILTRALVRRILFIGVLILVGAFGLFEWEQSSGASIAQARTVAVNVVVMVELVYLFSCRSLSRSTLHIGLFSNPWALGGAMAMALAQLLFTYAPVMNRAFSTAPIDLSAWGRILAVAVIAYALVEFEKWLARRRAG